MSSQVQEWYSAREIALAAGVPEPRVAAALGGPGVFAPHDVAVALGRELAGSKYFSLVDGPGRRFHSGLPLVVSGTLHAGLLGSMLLILAMGRAPQVAAATEPAALNDGPRLVYLNLPGPGGGGGGGGRLEPRPAPAVKLAGTRTLPSPLPRREPAPVDPPPPPEPPPLTAEVLPPVMAPVVPSPSDPTTRVGVLESPETAESRGPGRDEGAGSGRGNGVGEGRGGGIGEGSGGGTGGGPYRPGSGITPPRLIHEVKADYTDAARRVGVSGDVVLEIVVTRNGSVGDIKLLRGLRPDLDERAIQAVRQWRFSPATRQGSPVDVLVEVAVEFKIR